MAGKNKGETPDPMKRYVKKATKRRNANNGDKCPSGWKFWHNSEQYLREHKIFLSLEPGTFDHVDINGAFYRLGWSTEKERNEEYIRSLSDVKIAK